MICQIVNPILDSQTPISGSNQSFDFPTLDISISTSKTFTYISSEAIQLLGIRHSFMREESHFSNTGCSLGETIIIKTGIKHMSIA